MHSVEDFPEFTYTRDRIISGLSPVPSLHPATLPSVTGAVVPQHRSVVVRPEDGSGNVVRESGLLWVLLTLIDSWPGPWRGQSHLPLKQMLVEGTHTHYTERKTTAWKGDITELEIVGSWNSGHVCYSEVFDTQPV